MDIQTLSDISGGIKFDGQSVISPMMDCMRRQMLCYTVFKFDPDEENHADLYIQCKLVKYPYVCYDFHL